MVATGNRPRITYVTDLACTLSGGGAYAVNWHAFTELRKRFDALYAGPITPFEPLVESVVSKVRRRVLKRPGTYAYFGPRALEENARNASRYFKGSDAIVFRSAARWCRCQPPVPYFIYLDAVTHTFFHNTFSEKDFITDDLERIWRQEAEFLENAAGVFFESDWGRRKAIAAYALNADHYFVAGRGGVIAPPPDDAWNKSSHSLVTVAMNFRQKGGDIVREAYQKLTPEFDSLSWHIVGGKPDFDPASLKGVHYEGVLRPDIPREEERLRAILASAFVLLHPTREDTSPLVITESAYFGCPAISVNAFALPELVVDGTTGLLLDLPVNSEDLAEAIRTLLTDGERYGQMRRDARAYSLARFQWSGVGALICDYISKVLGS